MRFTLIAGLMLASVALSGCASMGIGGSTSGLDINKFLTDPACAHDDKVSGVTGAGGIPASLQFSAERHCPAAVAPAPVAASPAT